MNIVFNNNDDEIEVFISVDGKDYIVGHILSEDFMEEDAYLLKDTLFDNETYYEGSQDVIIDIITEYYRNSDSIGKIKEKYINYRSVPRNRRI